MDIETIEGVTSREITERIELKRNFFQTHTTKEMDFRIRKLKGLRGAIEKYEEEITQALWKDLHKSKEEAYLTEISIVTQEIDLHIKKLKSWAKPKKVSVPVHLMPSNAKITYEPLGVALIIAPWNYPFQLLFNPLAGAISSGCCAVLKPSEFTPNTAAVMEKIIAETFPQNYISLIQGGKETGELLLKQRWDIIFFTGSTQVGKIVMKAAAEHLTPVILELGGKSPAIIDETANIALTAKRIAWGKTINAGQTCIAPDYLLVHKNVKNELLREIATSIKEMHGEEIGKSSYYGRIVHEKAYDRLINLMEGEKLYSGGESNREDLFIEPTILDEVAKDSRVMQEEIFGPVLPVMTFSELKEATDYINSGEKPLALYYFGKKEKANDVIAETSSGGVCINDTLMHISNHNLPFGGVGASGMGSYHGKESFLAFSHRRSVVRTPTWIDIPFKYAPFKYFKLIRKMI
ncbi:MAG TPA: aldehyde dehydrogenase [Gillisia sp.]|nr:aldehyde dehydrogenase [Gillisia sp.]